MRILLLFFGLLFAPLGTYASDDFSLLIYGASIHSKCNQGNGLHAKTCDFNGTNPGAGLEWVFAGDDDHGRLAMRVGAYEDSHRKTAGFVNVAYRKDWPIYRTLRFGAGVQVGYLNGSGINGFAALPLITLGTTDVTLEIGYAPKMNHVPGRRHAAVTTFSLRWAL